MGVLVAVAIWIVGMLVVINVFPDGYGRGISFGILTAIGVSIIAYGNTGKPTPYDDDYGNTPKL